MSKIYYERDVDKGILRGKKIAVIGFGNQGHAQAQNLKDGGYDVVVGLRRRSRNAPKAKEAGLEVLPIADAVKVSDIIVMLVPDEIQGEIYTDHIEGNLGSGRMLMFAHGFAVTYSQVVPPKGVDVTMVAPKGQGHMLRRAFTAGRGLPALLAVHRNYSGKAKEIALAYARGIGATRVGVIETTFKEETEADLFSEQAVICGGVSSLMKAGFEILVEAGFQPETAYFECVNEMKLIVDLIYEKGLSYMRKVISNTAEFGDYRAQGKIITEESRQNMKDILENIRSGKFARDFLADYRAGQPYLEAMRRAENKHPLEKTGQRLRRKMDWI